ncbi:MAG: hypothetical protein J5I98_22925 [Phaeodactylibacter sp.]|nr:hypothetical protein [Phaeodactylibacter sp.]
MKKRKCNPKEAGHAFSLAIQSPGSNRTSYPHALEEVLLCLSPASAQDRQLLAQLRAYVFPVPWQPTPCRQEIRQRLRQSLPPEGRKKYLDIILTTLEGMKAIIEHYKLQSPEELDNHLQAHKEMFGRLLFEKGGRAQPGRPGEVF